MTENHVSHVALVVDHDDIFRDRLCRALEARGWKTKGAADGAAALRLAAATSPDLTIVDLGLPEMVGLDVVRALRGLDKATCIIMLSGYGSSNTALTAKKLGVDHHLRKPADTDEILGAYKRVTTRAPEPERSGPEARTLARVEREHIQRVLVTCEGNITHAAKLLGLHRRSLQRKLQRSSSRP